jgi:hypothetical protein
MSERGKSDYARGVNLFVGAAFLAFLPIAAFIFLMLWVLLGTWELPAKVAAVLIVAPALLVAAFYLLNVGASLWRTRFRRSGT